MNCVTVLMPYKFAGQWVFDDPTVGLHREAFIAGADVILDQMTADIPDAASGFRLLFSGQPFPGHTVHLELMHIDAASVGHWYQCPDNNLIAWLCPALLKYFKDAPKDIYAQAEPKS